MDRMLRKLVKTTRIELDGPVVDVRYFEQRTARGARRYSSEVLIGAGDRIIIDDDSMSGLESKVDRLVPAVLWSRMLAARTATVAA
jgi:predicted RNase H-like nuclease (RuvC/YqgF family)